MAFDQGYALLIGVGTHQYAPKWNVPMTMEDAQALGRLLCDPNYCGYPDAQVKALLGKDATRANILRELDWLAEQATENSTVVFFFSGHGLYDNGQNYHLVSHDARIAGKMAVPGTAVSQVELLEKMRKIKAQRMLLIFNACHSGNISPTLGDPAVARAGSQTLPTQTADALLATGSGRIIITACREQQSSYYRFGDSLTLFAQTLLSSLRGEDMPRRDEKIYALDVYINLFNKVSRLVQQLYQQKQEPELTVLKGVGPFAVALYPRMAGATLGSDSGQAELPRHPAVRQVTEEQARQMFNQIVTQSGGVNFGQNNQVQINGPVTGGDSIDTGGGAYIGGSVHVGRDFVGRDKIVYGDEVHGDKVGGDKITVGNITNSSNVAIGKNITAIYGASSNDLGQVFEPLYAAVRSSVAAAAQPDVLAVVREVQREVEKGSRADDKALAKQVRRLVGLAPGTAGAVKAVLASAAVKAAVGPFTEFVLEDLG